MKIIDNIDYNATIKEFEKTIREDKTTLRKLKMHKNLKLISTLILLITSIFVDYSIFNTNFSVDVREVCGVLGFFFTAGTIFLFVCFLFDLDDVNFAKKQIKGKKELYEEKLDEKEKAIKISGLYNLYNTYNLNDIFKQIEFLQNTKILKATVTKNSNILSSHKLNINYVQNNEVKTKTMYLRLHMFEKLDEPELIIYNELLLPTLTLRGRSFCCSNTLGGSGDFWENLIVASYLRQMS